MIDTQEEAIKALVSQSKSASLRTPLVPEVAADISDAPPGLMWIRTDETGGPRAYLKTSTNTLFLGGSGISGGGGGTVGTRSLSADSLMLNSITVDEMGPDSVGASELAPKAVTDDSFADIIHAESSLTLTAPQPILPALTLDAHFDHTTDLFRVRHDGGQRLRVDKDRVAVGNDLPGAAVSIQTALTDVTLRLRGSGGAILAERQNGALIFSVDAQGNATFAGSVASLSGNSNTQGTQSIQGALTVSDQTNLLAGLSVTGRTDLLAEVYVAGRMSFDAEPYLPADYSIKVGQGVHVRTIVGTDNRVVFEGVQAVGVAELQLGTGGPVLRGTLANNSALYVNGNPVLTGAPGGLTGSQMARDTVTGASGPGVGNIAAETITGWNIKNGSITSTELSPGAVVQTALAAGSVGPIQLADGSVIDRVVASLGVGKLISGTLNADEVFMGPSGHIYLGPTYTDEITGERIQIDASGIRAYNSFNTPLAEFAPGGFTLRTGVDGARLQFNAATGIELFGLTGQRTGYLSPLGEFQLASITDGASMRMNSNDGVLFIAAATRNLAYNPGFIGGSERQTPVASEAVDDQTHVFAGEYAVKFRSTNPNVTVPSYVDVPLKNTVGTGQSVTRVRTNYCPNPSAEVNATGWLSGAPTNQVGQFGQALGFIRDRAVWVVATAAGDASIQAPVVSTGGGVQWALSASVRVSTGQNVVAEIVWYNVNNAVISSSLSTSIALKTNVVTQVGLVAYAPSNATTFRLKINASLSNTDKFEVSNILYDRNSGIDAYFDGFSEGYQWSGAPGSSTSYLVPVAVLDSPNNILSIYVWSDVPAWGQIEARDGTANASRGLSAATRLTPHQWSRISVLCNGRMDRVRLHYPSTDPARQTRITVTPVWFSGVQVEADKTVATPFCSGNEPGCRWEGLEAKSASVRDRDVVVTQISPSLGTTVSGAIVGGSLTSASFFAGRIFGTEITGGTITGAILRGNVIYGDQIMAGTLSASSLTSRSITADMIQVGTLTGDLLQANTITGDKVSANTLTGTNISGRSITGDKFVAGTISALELAARAVTADKLQADLVLSSRIIAGASVTGARVEMAAGTGLQAFSAAGVRTFLIEAATGKAFFMGELSSAPSGARVVINSGGTTPDTIRLYDSTSPNYATIQAATISGQAGILMSGNSVRSDGHTAQMTVRPDYASLLFGQVGGNIRTRIETDLYHARLYGPVVDLGVDRRNSSDAYYHIGFFHLDTSGAIIQNSLVSHQTKTNDEAWFCANARDSGWVFGVSSMHAYNGSGTGLIPVWASAFTVGSSEEIKTDVGNLPANFNPVKELKGKVKRFKYATPEAGQDRQPDAEIIKRRRSQRRRDRVSNPLMANEAPAYDWQPGENPWHIGPMAEDLPDWLHRRPVDHPDGSPGLNIADLAGLALWGVDHLDDRMTELELQVQQLTLQVVALVGPNSGEDPSTP